MAPYRTDCVDYRQYDCKSQHSCIGKCVSDSLYEHLDLICGGLLTTDLNNRTQFVPLNGSLEKTLGFGKHPNYNYSIYVQVSLYFHYECQKKFEKDACYQSIYSDYSTPDFTEQSNEMTVNIKSGRRPNMFIQFVPKLTTIDFIVYVLSSISFWLCFNPYPFVMDMMVVIKKCGNQEVHSLHGSHRKCRQKIKALNTKFEVMQLELNNLRHQINN